MLNEKKRALWAGIFILGAYAILASTMTDYNLIVIPMEVMSGLMVMAIPFLLIPSFSKSTGTVKGIYIGGKLLEGGLMVIGAFLLLSRNGSESEIRDLIYDFHAYIFIISATFLYILFYRENNIPRFISLWGFVATLSLLIGNILMSIGVESSLITLFFPLIMLNEVFMAFWLIIKGMK